MQRVSADYTYLSRLSLRSCLWCLSLDRDLDRLCLLLLLSRSRSRDLDLDLRGMLPASAAASRVTGWSSVVVNEQSIAWQTLTAWRRTYACNRLSRQNRSIDPYFTPFGAAFASAFVNLCAMSRNWKFCPYSGDLLVMDPVKGTATCRSSNYIKPLKGHSSHIRFTAT